MGAIASHSTPTTEVPWDAGANEARLNTPLTQDVARAFYAWKEGAGWPPTKSAYKFGHHVVAGDGTPGAANTKACSGTIAVLNGGRGGSNIPDGDRKGVYNHVARHLRDAGKEPPPLMLDDGTEYAYDPGLEIAGDEGMYLPRNNLIPLEAQQEQGRGLLPPEVAVGRDSLSLPLVAEPVSALRVAIALLGESVWAIDPNVLQALMSVARSGFEMPDAALLDTVAAKKKTDPGMYGSSVAVIPLSGVITPKPSILSMLFGGGGGLEGFRENLHAAVNSPDVGAVVLNIDSPGGSVSLVPETAREVREARAVKPIVAVANTLAASAAYWIGSQADELVVTPSGQVGSVGVYMVHDDMSGRLEQMGIKPTYISAGKFKIDGNADQPLSETAKDHFQERVDELYGEFVDEVAAGRGATAENVKENYGEGRVMSAHRAVSAGMADRVGTLEGVIGGLLGSGGGTPAGPQASGEAQASDAAPEPEQPAAQRTDAAARAAVLFG